MSEVVRVSPDGSRVLVRVSDGEFGVVAAGSGRVQMYASVAEARKGQHWQKPTDEQLKLFASAPEIVEAARTSLAISETPRSESRRVYRIPAGVRDEARRGLRWAQLHGADAELLAVAKQLAESESIGVNDVQTISELRIGQTIDVFSQGYQRGDEGYPSRARIDHALFGGHAGEAWLNKLARTHKLTLIASGFSFNSSAVYMAGGKDPESTQVTHLYSLVRDDSDSDFADDDAWSEYVDGNWTAMETPPDDAQLIELNQESATALASWLDDADTRTEADTPYFELQDINPVERNLFELAAPFIDWVEIDRAATLAATDGVYTPQERSSNAQRQQRSAGGRFGAGSGGATSPQSQATQVQNPRARLPQQLPLVEDINQLIAAYLEGLQLSAGAATPDTTTAPAPAADDKPVTAAAQEAPAPGGAPPLYLAIVDATDTTAVLDLIALVPADETNADVTALRRTGGQWVPAPEMVTDLRGDTPPPVVQLTPDIVDGVIAQVDQSDSAQPAAPDQGEPVTQAPTTPAPVAASGWAGLFGEFGEIVPIYGPRGDAVSAAFVAAGVPGIEDTPSDKMATDRLRRYWAHGEGAAKIRWGTPGDLTRCHREINKYMDSDRAWGFCQLRHREATGEWNKD